MIEPPTPAPVGVIEIDAFCDRCGFNLHTQRVWRDERLGILVCRCPECGGHQPAGVKTSATSVWLRRVALLATTAWAILAFLFVVGMFFFALGIHAAAEEGLTERRYETRDGRPVELDWSTSSAATPGPRFLLETADSAESRDVPAEQVILRRRLASWVRAVGDDASGRPPRWQAQIVGTCVVSLILAVPWYFCSTILAAGSWFWRPWLRWLWLLIPILAGTTAFILTTFSDNNRNYYWGQTPYVDSVSTGWFMGTICLATTAVMALGLRSGRPLARLLVRVFIPPKPRQLFAFLWHCDGKVMPAARTTPSPTSAGHA